MLKRAHLLASLGALLPWAAVCSFAEAREPLFRPQVVIRAAHPPQLPAESAAAPETGIETAQGAPEQAVRANSSTPVRAVPQNALRGEPRERSYEVGVVRKSQIRFAGVQSELPSADANADQAAPVEGGDVPPPPNFPKPAQPVPVQPLPIEPSPEQSPAQPARPVQPEEELPATDGTMANQPPLPIEVPLASVTTGIAPQMGKMPANPAQQWSDKGADEGYLFAQVGLVYYWDAPNFCYQPLYFEEPNLERLGYSRCAVLQPATSGIHFMASTLALPYQMTLHPYRRDCIYPLGHYRPGSPVPYRRILPEWDAKAAAVQAAATTGLIFVIP